MRQTAGTARAILLAAILVRKRSKEKDFYAPG